MMREPVATTETWQVRVAAKILTKEDLFPSLLNCADFRVKVIRRFAQSTLINVDSHGVVSGL